MSNEYQNMLNILKENLSDKYILQTYKTDKFYFTSSYSKVRDLNSVLQENGGVDSDYTYKGIYIDIFPIVYANKYLVRISSSIRHHLINPFLYKRIDTKYNHNILRILFYICQFIYILFSIVNIFFKHNRLNYKWGVYFPMNCKKDDIFPLSKIEFEGYLFNAPNNPDYVLKKMYGNYMELPKEKDINPHSSFVRIEYDDKNI